MSAPSNQAVQRACTNEISPQDYSLLVKQARQFLSGSNQDIQGELAQQIQAASDVQDFELAAEYRDHIRALTYIQSTTDVFARTIESRHHFACSRR